MPQPLYILGILRDGVSIYRISLITSYSQVSTKHAFDVRVRERRFRSIEHIIKSSSYSPNTENNTPKVHSLAIPVDA